MGISRENVMMGKKKERGEREREGGINLKTNDGRFTRNPRKRK